MLYERFFAGEELDLSGPPLRKMTPNAELAVLTTLLEAYSDGSPQFRSQNSQAQRLRQSWTTATRAGLIAAPERPSASST